MNEPLITLNHSSDGTAARAAADPFASLRSPRAARAAKNPSPAPLTAPALKAS